MKISPSRLRRRMSRLTRTAVKFVDGVASDAGPPLVDDTLPVWMFRAPTLNLPTSPVKRAAADDGDDAARLQPDSPAVEDFGDVLADAAAGARTADAAAEVEDPAPFLEELALLRETPAETASGSPAVRRPRPGRSRCGR